MRSRKRRLPEEGPHGDDHLCSGVARGPGGGARQGCGAGGHGAREKRQGGRVDLGVGGSPGEEGARRPRGYSFLRGRAGMG